MPKKTEQPQSAQSEGGADSGKLPPLSNPRDECKMVAAILQLAGTLRSSLATSLSECDLNDARYAVLQALAVAGSPGCSQTKLARQLGYSESNISTLLDRMAADGLVRRRRSETDRRKSLIQLSAQGAALLDRAHRSYQQSACELLEGIPALQCTELTRQLDRIRRNLDSTLAITNLDAHLDSKQSDLLPARIASQSQHHAQQSRLI